MSNTFQVIQAEQLMPLLEKPRVIEVVRQALIWQADGVAHGGGGGDCGGAGARSLFHTATEISDAPLRRYRETPERVIAISRAG